LNALVSRLARITGKRSARALPTNSKATDFRAGDLVRIRSGEDIRATLDGWGELRNCLFMEGMWQYCGTIQRVLKPLERFVDERDYGVKQSSGIVLLEGAICQGTEMFGRCDRCCFFFWRKEWLEKID
jgi:hypothetical protein